MAKKDENEIKLEEKSESQGEPKEKIEAKIDKKIEQSEKKVEKITGEKENIINYVPKPRVEDPDFDFKSWAKSVDEKIDQLLGQHKSKEVDKKVEELPKPETEKKVSFWEREII